ncbi:MAG: hypothetical protein WBN09_04995 [Woeseiaceae bacterium]
MKEHQAPGKSTKPIAGLAALLVCLPAFGASSIDVICDDADIAKIEDTVTEFSASPASSDSHLTPQAEELIRQAFEDGEEEEVAPESTPVTSDNTSANDKDESLLPAALPGLSNERTEAYKRQMFRTDI